jgi:hypothetical protein
LTEIIFACGSGFPAAISNPSQRSRLEAAPTYKIDGTIILCLMELVERNAGQQMLYQIGGFRTIILL